MEAAKCICDIFECGHMWPEGVILKDHGKAAGFGRTLIVSVIDNFSVNANGSRGDALDTSDAA